MSYQGFGERWQGCETYMPEIDRQLLEEQALVAEILHDRQKNDPLLNFQLHPKQQKLVDACLNRTSDEIWYCTANRHGKTTAGAYVGSHLARFGWPNARYQNLGGGLQVKDTATSGWVIAKDFSTSEQTVQPRYFDNGFVNPNEPRPFIPKHEIVNEGGSGGWNVGSQVLKLKNGSLVGYKSDESEAIKFAAATKDWIHFDEVPKHATYDEATMRIGPSGLLVFGTATLLPPEQDLGGVSWLYQMVLEPWMEGKRPDVLCMGGSIYDNPHISREAIAKQEAKYPDKNSKIRRIRLDGEWLADIVGTRAYGAFDQRLHVKKQAPPLPRRPLCWIWDFNVEPLVTLIGQRDITGPQAGLFRVIKELSLDEGFIGDMCDWFYQEYGEHHGEIWLYGDQTGESRDVGLKMDQASYYSQIMNAMRVHRVPIKMKVQERNPPVPLRLISVNNALVSSSGLVNVEIDPSCTELLADLKIVVRDARGGIKKTSDPKNPYRRRTHASDGLGYWITYEQPVRRERTDDRPNTPIPCPGYGTG